VSRGDDAVGCSRDLGQIPLGPVSGLSPPSSCISCPVTCAAPTVALPGNPCVLRRELVTVLAVRLSGVEGARTISPQGIDAGWHSVKVEGIHTRTVGAGSASRTTGIVGVAKVIKLQPIRNWTVLLRLIVDFRVPVDVCRSSA
jgi:hypothetical protein